MIKKIAKKITQICVAIALMIAPVISTAGLGHNAKVYAVQHGTDLSGAYVLNSGSEVNQAGADAFATALATALSASSSDYADIESTATQAGTSVASSNIYVQFGGIKWLVTYVSRLTKSNGTAGDAIATLWMADYPGNTAITSKYQNWISENPNSNYPSNMYGSSYIRTVLNGGNYAQAYTVYEDENDNTPASDNDWTDASGIVQYVMVAGTQNNIFKPFTSTYNNVNLTSYIAKPYDSLTETYVSWQKYGQKSSTKFGWDYDLSNENFGTLTMDTDYSYTDTLHDSNVITGIEYVGYSMGDNPEEWDDFTDSGNGYGNNDGMYDEWVAHKKDPSGADYLFYAGNEEEFGLASSGYEYSSKTNNADWAEDYLWLPSLYETGMNESNTNNKGLWNLTNAQRQYGAGSGYESTDYSWLRSGTAVMLLVRSV